MKMNKVKQRFIAFFKGRNCPAAATALLVAVSVMVLNLIFYTVGSSVPMYLRFTEEPDLSIGSSSDDNFADAVARGDKVTVTMSEQTGDGDGLYEAGETVRVTINGLHMPIPKIAKPIHLYR